MKLLNENKMRKFDINEWLIKLADSKIKGGKLVYFTWSGVHLTNQLLSTRNSSTIKYGGYQIATLCSDFIYKLNLIFKELKENFNALEIIHKAELSYKFQQIKNTCNDVKEIIVSLVKNIETVRKSSMTIKKQLHHLFQVNLGIQFLDYSNKVQS